ncbi:MAG: HU family DNA-binding protein [bacterium]|nr:HU family DNA-binding protein [bacterium]
MTKDNLIEAFHQKMGGTKRSAAEAVELIFDEITKTLSKGQEVAITGFGSFRVVKRAGRTGVNPRTGEKIQIPAVKVPKFRAGKALKEAVK